MTTDTKVKHERFKDRNWVFRQRPDGGIENWTEVQCAILMDIRDELKQLNALLNCRNFTQIPATLRGLRRDIKGKK